MMVMVVMVVLEMQQVVMFWYKAAVEEVVVPPMKGRHLRTIHAAAAPVALAAGITQSIAGNFNYQCTAVTAAGSSTDDALAYIAR